MRPSDSSRRRPKICYADGSGEIGAADVGFAARHLPLIARQGCDTRFSIVPTIRRTRGFFCACTASRSRRRRAGLHWPKAGIVSACCDAARLADFGERACQHTAVCPGGGKSLAGVARIQPDEDLLSGRADFSRAATTAITTWEECGCPPRLRTVSSIRSSGSMASVTPIYAAARSFPRRAFRTRPILFLPSRSG